MVCGAIKLSVGKFEDTAGKFYIPPWVNFCNCKSCITDNRLERCLGLLFRQSACINRCKFLNMVQKTRAGSRLHFLTGKRETFPLAHFPFLWTARPFKWAPRELFAKRGRQQAYQAVAEEGENGFVAKIARFPDFFAAISSRRRKFPLSDQLDAVKSRSRSILCRNRLQLSRLTEKYVS